MLFDLLVRVPAPSDLRIANFSGSDITVRWEAAADDVVSYLIKWISLSEGDLRQVSSNSNTSSVTSVQSVLIEIAIYICALYNKVVIHEYVTVDCRWGERGGNLGGG